MWGILGPCYLKMLSNFSEWRVLIMTCLKKVHVVMCFELECHVVYIWKNSTFHNSSLKGVHDLLDVLRGRIMFLYIALGLASSAQS